MAKNSYYIITEEDKILPSGNKNSKPKQIYNEAFSVSPHSKTYHLRIQNLLSP